MEENVYQHRIDDIGVLRECIVSAWDELDLHVIDAAVRPWWTRQGKWRLLWTQPALTISDQHAWLCCVVCTWDFTLCLLQAAFVSIKSWRRATSSQVYVILHFSYIYS